MHRLTLAEMLNMINEPNGSNFKELYKDNWKVISIARGSRSKHQAWEGGYVDHLEEMGTMGNDMYQLFTVQWRRKLPFDLSDIMTVVVTHDLEKPWKHRLTGNIWTSEPSLAGANAHKFVSDMLSAYHIELSDAQKNALKYVHGENEEHDPLRNVTNKLGAFCHSLDYMSARVFHNYPKGVERHIHE